ncbi:uncharacterized protein LOC142764933 [Rhipicephalus microplus]|uniref:Putative kunitz n=1 Tax=Rhipicephalus microplus TaxID=6941 RepID=A0A6G5A2R9_RHIMP
MCSMKTGYTCCYMVLCSVIVTCVGLLLDEGHSWHNSSRERHHLMPPPPDENPPLKEEDPDKRPEKCLLQYDSGVCEEFKPSTVWLYSTTYGACMPLTYYGCMRKENWLSSCEECKKECKSDVCAEEDLEPRGEK